MVSAESIKRRLGTFLLVHVFIGVVLSLVAIAQGGGSGDPPPKQLDSVRDRDKLHGSR